MSKSSTPTFIVIRRNKKGGHGHHGGAWKIAYADFVTAMMAFFLLMWLLSSVTKAELSSVETYFRTPLKVALFGGAGSGDQSSILQGSPAIKQNMPQPNRARRRRCSASAISATKAMTRRSTSSSSTSWK